MPVDIDGVKYYRMAEAAVLGGISKSTLLRWMQNGVIRRSVRRDRRGWRVFTREQVEEIRREAHRLEE